MTDDLATLLVQTGGQLTGMIIKMGITTIPTGLNVMSSLLNPLLWVIPYGLLVGVPDRGSYDHAFPLESLRQNN